MQKNKIGNKLKKKRNTRVALYFLLYNTAYMKIYMNSYRVYSPEGMDIRKKKKKQKHSGQAKFNELSAIRNLFALFSFDLIFFFI